MALCSSFGPRGAGLTSSPPARVELKGQSAEGCEGLEGSGARIMAVSKECNVTLASFTSGCHHHVFDEV